jgi:hypothetical protein
MAGFPRWLDHQCIEHVAEWVAHSLLQFDEVMARVLLVPPLVGAVFEKVVMALMLNLPIGSIFSDREKHRD